MEFLAEYGLFFAKTVTFVVAFIIVVGVVVANSQKSNKPSGDIEIEKLNDKITAYKDRLNQVVMSKEDMKKLRKQEKKDKKEKAKAAKKKSDKNKDEQEQATKRVFVVDFDGDIKASDAENLRELISAILLQATENDEVVVRLESSGGMVHSYGFAAGQLARVTSKKVPLTVCVDHVAASGGYMMACVADKIVAAPFAIIGSIGVVAQLPNFHKLLKKTDIDYEMYTAGEYKRTLTMFGENTDKGREKFVEELEDTHVLFKDYIQQYRGVVDIDKVATGETWFGKRAIEQKLVDELATSDEYLYTLADDADIYLMKIEQKQSLAEKLGFSFASVLEKSVERGFNLVKTRYFS